MDNKELKIATEKFGLDTVTAIAVALRAVGANNSGSLINSLRAELKDVGENLDLMIKGNSYFNIIEKGRRPGEQPPLADIVKWAKSKGLPEAAAFPIAKNIGKFGIKPRPILKQIIESNDFKDNYGLLAEAYAKDVTKEINNILKDIK